MPTLSMLQVLALALTTAVFPPARQADEPLDAILPPVEVLLEHQKQLQLTPDQMRTIQQEIKGASAQHEAVQRQAADAKRKLREILAAAPFDEAAAQRQLQRALELELQMRRIAMEVRIRLNARLTEEQRKLIAGLTRPRPGTDRQQLQDRLVKSRQMIRGQAEAGSLSQQAMPLLRQAAQLLQGGRNREAAAALDQLDAVLTGNAPAMREDARTRTFETARRHPKSGIVEETSFVDTQAAVRQLKAPEVAWRKIGWKTCLLDGLKTSRQQNKPLILWIFIDRPIDDERC